MPPIPPPKTGFVTTLEKVSRTNSRPRWRSADGRRLYEWDALHGEFEVYTRQGIHIGVANDAGVIIKDAVPGRTIDV